MKTCSKCKKELSLDNFYPSKSNKNGYQSFCKSCQKLEATTYRNGDGKKNIALKWKRWYEKDPKGQAKRTRDYEKRIGNEEKTRRRKLYNKNSKFTRYSITESEYNHLLENQKQKCGMCHEIFEKNKPKSIHIDHDHVSGYVRGILCAGCNLFLGRIESDSYQRRVEQAQTYLRKTEKAGDKELLANNKMSTNGAR